MKNIHKLLLGCIIIFVAANTYIFLTKKTKSKDPAIFPFYWEQKQIFQIKNLGEYTFWNPIFYYGTDSCYTYTFKEKFDKPILIFYFTIEACQPCLDAIINSIKDTFVDYEVNENILLLSDDLEWRLRVSFFGKKIINIKDYKNSPIFMDKKIPTLFLIDPQTEIIHHVFPYNKETHDYLNDYLHTIKERFFQK